MAGQESGESSWGGSGSKREHPRAGTGRAQSWARGTGMGWLVACSVCEAPVACLPEGLGEVGAGEITIVIDSPVLISASVLKSTYLEAYALLSKFLTHYGKQLCDTLGSQNSYQYLA